MDNNPRLKTDKKGNTWIVRIRGDFTGESARDFDEAHTLLGEAGVARVVYDFSGMEYINSAGLALILDYVSRERDDAPEFRAFGMNEHFSRIIRMVDMQHYVGLCENEEEALAD